MDLQEQLKKLFPNHQESNEPIEEVIENHELFEITRLSFKFTLLSREFNTIKELRYFFYSILVTYKDDVVSNMFGFQI